MAEQDETNNISLKVDVFIQRYQLPQTVVVTEGSEYAIPSLETLRFRVGDILLLRSVTIVPLSATVYDVNNYSREIKLAPNFPGTFVVICDEDDTQQDGYANVGNVVYQTVNDLVQICPPYFRSTTNYVDPLTKDLVFGPNDRFRFIMLIHDLVGQVYIECKHMSGRVLKLPGHVRGDFQALHDANYHSLSELTTAAPVARKLRIANDSINTKYQINGLPDNFKGTIYMRKPDRILHISPWGDLDTVWKLPLHYNNDLHVAIQCMEAYETPISALDANKYNMNQFLSTFENSLPVHAELKLYQVLSAFGDQHHTIPSNTAIVLYSSDKVEKVLARVAREKYFIFTPHLNVICTIPPSIFRSIAALACCAANTEVRVLQNIAWDVPKTMTLFVGDILKVSENSTKRRTASMKLSGMTAPVRIPIVKFLILTKKGNYQKIKLPLDLEVDMVEIKKGFDKPYKLEDFFSCRKEFPLTIDITETSREYEYLKGPVSLHCFIRDPCVLVSHEVPGDKPSKPVTRFVQIPLRHNVMLSYSGQCSAGESRASPTTTQAAEDYYDFPVEEISSRTFFDLETNDCSYETLTYTSKPTIPLPTRDPSARSHRRALSLATFSTISKSLPSLSSVKGHRKSWRRKKGVPSPLSEDSLNLSSPSSPLESQAPSKDADNLYEDVVLKPVPKPSIEAEVTHTKQRRSLKDRLAARFPDRGKIATELK